MVSVPRRGAIASAVMATAAAAAGLGLHAGSGQAFANGFFRYAAVAMGTGVLGAFILWHRPRNRYGLTHLTIGVLFGAVILAAGVLARAGTPAALPRWAGEMALAWSWLAAALLLPLWVIVIAAFPDGRFHRSGVRRATIALAIVMPLLALLAYLTAPPGAPPPLIPVDLPPGMAGPLAPAGRPHMLFPLVSVPAAVLGTLAPMAAIAALVDRYRKAGPIIRQQIKWLLVGAAISVGLQAMPVQAFDSEALRTAAQVVVLLAVPLPLLAAAIAIFKHGLWEIDVVISKGLVYALASGVLSALFLGIALVAGVSVGGRDARVVGALGLALVVSFLAQPLRRRLEKVVARALYGDEPRGLVALAALARLGDDGGPALDAGRLGGRIAEITRSALGASWAAVWLHLPGERTGSLRPVGVAGAMEVPSVVLPRAVATALLELSRGTLAADLPTVAAETIRPLLSDEDAVVTALTSGGTLVGLLACGGRPKEPYGEEDFELLAVVARDAALSLRNIRLEGELRQRLDQIEQQAIELRRSRQRLVTAQDQERRRIERDLHDGTQQQLVALAARLRRVARADEPGIDRALEDLANEAEEAVFALQELARGIYPSLLADRGLAAALRTHAARLPVNVRIEVGPSMHEHRLGPEIEAAFYFVALEAMTNAVKHAPGAGILVSLRADPSRRRVTLEVHDDGPGFDPPGDPPGAVLGDGLQNMSDRIEAVGGAFSVESVRGAGTWIRAEVVETADVRSLTTGLTSREATPGGGSGRRPPAG